MSELPQGWVEAPLLDVVELHDNRRIPLNSTERAAKQGEYPYYGANGLVDHISDYIFDGHYVLLAEDGGNFDKPERGVAYEAEGRFWVNNHAHILAPIGDMSPRFLKHWLNSINWMPHVGGSTRLKLTQAGMAQIRAPLPPLLEQHRIVVKVDGLTARTACARKELDRIPTLIVRYKQRLLALAFSGELTAGWRAAKGLSDAEEVTLADVAKGFSYGTSAKSAPAGDVPVLRMGNIQDGKLDWTNLVFTSDKTEVKKYALIPGDVLFNRTNSPELVGKTALYRGEQEAVYAGYLIRIQCTDKLMPEFLTYSLNGPAGRDYCWKVKTDGVSQSNINAKKIAAFRFLLPCLEEQAEIVRRIESAFGWLDRMAADHAAAARLLPKLDAAILAKAFLGELVPQDPNDEPAAKLLERIKAERGTEGRKPKSGRGRKPNGSKAEGMTEKKLTPRDRLLKDSEQWPAVGLTFEAIAMRNVMPHDSLRDALFELLSGPSPALQQRFNTDAEVMVIQRAAA